MSRFILLSTPQPGESIRPSACSERLLNHLWPQIKQRVPEARLLLVGRCAGEAFGAHASSDVTIASDVPDTRDYFPQMDVMLYAPPVGSGMKVKILEAFAMGTPVVTNDEGIEGIPVVDGIHAGVANDDAGLIDRAVQLLSDAPRRARYRAAARSLIESHCSEEATVGAVEDLYQSIRVRAGYAMKGY